MIIPPFAGVRLVEYRDRIELTPYFWFREFVGLGRFKANEVGPQPGDDLHPFFNAVMGDKEIWVVVTWRRYEDGRDEPINLECLGPDTTDSEAQKCYEAAVSFLNMTKKELEDLAKCIEPSDENRAYIEERFSEVKPGPPELKSIEERDLYQARLKVLAGIQPKTVELIHRADDAKDPLERERIEREAVQAYIAEMAHEWPEDLLKEWQRGNPIGTEWMQELVRVLEEPKREIDPINHALVLNWLRQKFNLLTAEELSNAILVITGQRLSPATLKKRRERLELTTKRRTGPRPRESQ